MAKWHYYAAKDGTGYWSMPPPYQTEDRYLAYVYADEKPTGGMDQSQHSRSYLEPDVFALGTRRAFNL